MLKCNHHPIPFLFLKVKNICYQSVDVQRIWHCKSAEVSTRIPSGLPAQRFKSLIRRSSLVGWVKVVQKKMKKHGKTRGKTWEKPWEKPILHFRNPRKQWCPGVRSCSLRPTQCGQDDRKVFPGWKTKRYVPLIFQDCKCSIYLDLFGDWFFMVACLFFTCNPFAVKQTRTLHTKKKHISLLLCIIPKHKGRG